MGFFKKKFMVKLRFFSLLNAKLSPKLPLIMMGGGEVTCDMSVRSDDNHK